MRLPHVALLVVIHGVALTAQASAQMAPMGGGGGGGGGAPPCMSDFLPLRQEAETRAAAIKKAADSKAPRPQVCKLFQIFSDAEAKVVAFVEKNQSWCGIPPQAVAQMKANHARTLDTKTKICSAGIAEGPPGPRGPNLGEALGVRALPTPESFSSGQGTFDTLTGNPLTR